jgi:Arc/MetJ-type ribon-helix-helix transcriptional regulator
MKMYDIFILNNHIFMATVSVPLSKGQQEALDSLVQRKVAPTIAAVMRKALERLVEEEAVAEVLRAYREPTLRGDLQTLVRKIK